MKQIRLPAPFSIPAWRVAICALLIASASQSVNARENNSANRSGVIFATNPADSGRLVIQRSPVLGSNVAITLHIDGKLVASLMRGTYEKSITPGPHTLTVSASYTESGQATLNVIPGKTYSYSVTSKMSKLALTPVPGSR